MEPAAPAPAVALTRAEPLEPPVLPPSSRPMGRAAGETFSLVAEFTLDHRGEESDVYRTPLPVLSNLMPTMLKGTHHFGSGPPPGFEVHGPKDPLAFERNADRPGTYGFDREWLYVGVEPGGKPPQAVDYFVRFPKATAAENDLNAATSARDLRSFLQRTLTVDTESSTGLFLPAPGQVSFAAQVPPSGVLALEATVLPPAIASATVSDGAELVVEVVVDASTKELARLEVAPQSWAPLRVDLSALAGREVKLVLRSEPGPTPTYDYVYLRGATVYSARPAPRRALLLFVDTLRPDHLGLYGYDRPTSPNLDAWAGGATVFTSARTVAPWTLPSARAALSGAQPEHWFEELTLAERFTAAGWHTEAFVTNAFLSQPFDMHRGWTRFRYDHLRPVAEVVGDAREVLERWPDRDVLLMVHLMEPHLPYEEPLPWRWRFVGFRPWALDSLSRTWLFEKARPEKPWFEDVKQYVIGRYDQNIRTVDHAVASLLEDLGPEATVVLFSDHGEEFWEHGSFEHGHSFHEELLKVPLVIRSPAMPVGRVDAPVSLLDIAPTLLELEGLPAEARHGSGLRAAAQGDPDALAALAARPAAFGRPLYGKDGWGVVADGHKWFGRGGQRYLYHLESDPLEARELGDQVDSSRFPGALAAALEREVVLAWRLKIFSKTTTTPVQLTVSHPGGIKQAWNSYDPRGRAAGAAPQLEDGRVVLVQDPGEEMPAAVYLLPAKADPLGCEGLEVRIQSKTVNLRGVCGAGTIELKAARQTLFSVGDNGWGASLDLEWTPVPAGVEVAGYAAELKEQLRELGYLEE